MPTISNEALQVLTNCTANPESNTVKLPEQELSRNVYEQVDDVLTRIGGKWNKRLKAHLFPYNPVPQFNTVLVSKELPTKNPTAFFPTPTPVVSLLLDLADSHSWPTKARILEPSAGTGAIAKAIKDSDEDGLYKIDCCEILPVNRQSLLNEGFDVVAEDFLSYSPTELYDAIVMNPPFSLEGDANAFMAQIYHAWNLLKPNGKFAAIVPTGWIQNSNKKNEALRNFIADYMCFEIVGEGISRIQERM